MNRKSTALDEQTAFVLGESAALDPDNEEQVASGRATTSLRSPWLHRRCTVCSHTFRPGDAVEVRPDGVVHASAELACAGGELETAVNPDAGEFFSALDETWPPPAGLVVVRLEGEHFLLAPPVAGFGRRFCAVCGHTFRPQDVVVLCPCFPQAPRCQLAIHRDVVHGLHCFDEWNPGAQKRHCLATSRVFDG